MTATYSDTIRQWAADVRRAGVLEHADGIGEVGLGAGETGTRLAVRFTLRVRDGRAETVRYQVFGCGFTIAACAATAELAEGHRLAEIATITPAWVDATLAGLPPERDYCATLAVAALQAAVKSAGNGRQPVAASIPAEDDHIPRVTTADTVYRLLIDSPPTGSTSPEDRHLFACLLAVAADEPYGTAAALGLSSNEMADLLHRYFPAVAIEHRQLFGVPAAILAPQGHPGILDLLLAHLPHDADGSTPPPSLWLARIIAARTAHHGHLWRAMGLFARPELTAAIHRHLPALAAANDKGMRWKRFLYKQLCEQGGGMICKTPDCGACSDYALCFAMG